MYNVFGFSFRQLVERLSFAHRHIFFVLSDEFVCGTDYLARVCYFLYSVRAPTRNTGNREYRGKEFNGNAEHFVNKAAVKVNVCGNAFIDMSFFCDYFRCKTLDLVINANDFSRCFAMASFSTKLLKIFALGSEML